MSWSTINANHSVYYADADTETTQKRSGVWYIESMHLFQLCIEAIDMFCDKESLYVLRVLVEGSS